MKTVFENVEKESFQTISATLFRCGGPPPAAAAAELNCLYERILFLL